MEGSPRRPAGARTSTSVYWAIAKVAPAKITRDPSRASVRLDSSFLAKEDTAQVRNVKKIKPLGVKEDRYAQKLKIFLRYRRSRRMPGHGNVQ